ncbi:MAG: Eco57I restriction-modification methylase domain-containing protein [Paludibacteraceae bacterium]|nr:Eco57I restriction-modification methylase domain-containing protein [Paludibacteraceae bacterium]
MEYTATFKNSLIYIFRINDSKHAKCLKIGEATAPDGLTFVPNCKELNEAAKKRIDSYTRTAGIQYELLHTEMTTYSKGGKILGFNDKQVHDVLLRSGIKKEKFGTNADEWFRCDLETAKNAIAAVKKGQSSLTPNQKSEDRSPVAFRPEQLRAIEQTKKVLKHGDKMLWNAKMRMGKTLTSLEVVRQMGFHRTIIVTHRPVVDEGWYEDYSKIFYAEGDKWLYGSKNRGVNNIQKLELSGKNYIYFASMQDLRGSKLVGGNFDKNEDVFSIDWDLLIIDEAHEGTQTELGKRVFETLDTEHTKVLNLSGTPFNLLESGDFDETNTFTWDYVMEQRAKQEWAVSHPGDHNPYEELPKLNILTFNLGDLAVHYQDEDKAFNFTEFFKTDDKGQFVYGKDIANFLDIISSNKGETLYPFSSTEYREFFHHTFWIVPGVKEGKALAEMLRTHSVFGSYKVVNVCGNEDEETTGDPLEEVRSAIGDHPEDTYTITLSCGKLTTGVTVREWTAVLYLAGSKNTSPASYMQTIFRVQSPGRIGGRMKTDCYVFDFAPDRTLKMVAETAKVSAKAGETDQEDRKILGDFLNFCPIIAQEGTEMKPYNVDQMMQQLKRVYVDKVVSTGFEDGHLYSKKLYDLNNVELERFADLREIIGQTKANRQSKDITINAQGYDKEDFEKAKREAKKKGKILTQEEMEALAKQIQKRKQRDTAVSILRGISIRMPLLLYGAKLDNEAEDITLDRFVEMVDDQSWAEFMPLGVTKERFAIYKKYYDEDIFSAAGKQIRQLALAADKMPVLQRIQRITEIFSAFRNPDKETVLTPWRVVNMHLSDTVGGYCFYDDFGDGTNAITAAEPHFVDRGLVSQRLFENANVRILEINSKSGLYPLYMAYSVFRYRLRVAQEMKRSLFRNQITVEEEQQVWKDVLAENIFIICKTEMARSITQRTLAGFTGAKVNTHVYDDLLNQITNKQPEFIKRLLSGSIFSQIKNNMKFDAIVGNPPYQEIKASDIKKANNAFATAVYPFFIDIAYNLKPKYVSLITPSRWLTKTGQGISEVWVDKMINCNNFICIHDYYDASEVFPGIEIKGGVNYFLLSPEYDGKCKYHLHFNGLDDQSTDYLNYKGAGIALRDTKASCILSKIINVEGEYFNNGRNFSNLVGPQHFFDKDGKLTTSWKGYKKNQDDEYNIKYYLNKNLSENGFAYIRKADIPKGIETLSYHKVYISKAYGAGDSFPHQIIGKPFYGEPNSVCSQTYLIIGYNQEKHKFSELECKNIIMYIRTRLFRYLVYVKKKTQDNPSSVFQFVPLQDFTAKSDIDWSKSVAEIDEQLYRKYGLTEEEVKFVEGMVKEME